MTPFNQDLVTTLVLLNRDKIQSNLSHHSIQMDIFQEINSTNDYLKQFVSQHQEIRVCMAESQIQGRGRLNRQWHSPFGENIYFSMLYPFKKASSELSGLSLVVALSICRAIESVVSIKKDCLKVKWPNDIWVNQQKLCGVLIEVQTESKGFCQLIIGIGINVNMDQASEKNITQPWVSLLQITQQSQDRNAICAELIDCLIDDFKQFLSKGLSAFTEEWHKRDVLMGRAIALLSVNQEIRGIYKGIDTQGHLLLQTKDNHIVAFSSGDTTLLKSQG